MQSKAVEWKLLRDIPKIRLSRAPVRDRMIDERAEDELDQAYLDPVKHRRIKRLRQQAWLVVVILHDSGMRRTRFFPCGSQPAKKVWSGFWSGFGKRILGANEPITVSA
jgi:hypothetical protein